jgi:hypothetical protein
VELLIARNPDPESRLPYLLLLPLAGGMVFRTSGTWPRTSALYCYPVPVDEWPESPDIVERAALRSCVRRGAAIRPGARCRSSGLRPRQAPARDLGCLAGSAPRLRSSACRASLACS